MLNDHNDQTQLIKSFLKGQISLKQAQLKAQEFIQKKQNKDNKVTKKIVQNFTQRMSMAQLTKKEQKRQYEKAKIQVQTKECTF